MSKYNKLWGALVGVIISFVLVWAAFAFPTFVTCSDTGNPDTCTIFGSFSKAELQVWVMAILGPILVERFPANTS